MLGPGKLGEGDQRAEIRECWEVIYEVRGSTAIRECWSLTYEVRGTRGQRSGSSGAWHTR